MLFFPNCQKTAVYARKVNFFLYKLNKIQINYFRYFNINACDIKATVCLSYSGICCKTAHTLPVKLTFENMEIFLRLPMQEFV